MPASIIMQLLITFFRGGFRRPRPLSWVLLVAAFVLLLAAPLHVAIAPATLGLRLWPDVALRALGVMGITGSVLVLLR